MFKKLLDKFKKKPKVVLVPTIEEQLELAKEPENIKKIQDQFKGTVAYNVNLTVIPFIDKKSKPVEIVYNILYQGKSIGIVSKSERNDHIQSIVMNAKAMFYELAPVIKNDVYECNDLGIIQIEEVFVRIESNSKTYLVRSKSTQNLHTINHSNLIRNSKKLIKES